MKNLLHTLLFTAALTTTAQAQPAYVNYQGKLTDDVGQAVPGGAYQLTFNIYDAPTGGTRIWGPFLCDGVVGAGHSALAMVANGRFNVVLGPQDTTGRALQDAFGSGNRFIEITVTNGAPILPRQQFLSNPYAFALSNTRYELTGSSMKTKGTNQLIFGDAVAPAVNGAISSQPATGLEVLGAGTNAASRKITLTGNISIPGNANIGGNAAIGGTLHVTNLTDGTRTSSIANVLREDPPMIVDIKSPGETTRWQIQEIDLRRLADDEDGCTIRLILHHELSSGGYEVLFAEQRIALERPGFSQKALTDTNTVNGRVIQLAGWNTSEWRFTLGDNVRQRIGEGWNWFYLWDYYPGGHNGEPDLDPPTGADKFKIYIALHPHVSARVIVYDR